VTNALLPFFFINLIFSSAVNCFRMQFYCTFVLVPGALCCYVMPRTVFSFSPPPPPFSTQIFHLCCCVNPALLYSARKKKAKKKAEKQAKFCCCCCCFYFLLPRKNTSLTASAIVFAWRVYEVTLWNWALRLGFWALRNVCR